MEERLFEKQIRIIDEVVARVAREILSRAPPQYAFRDRLERMLRGYEHGQG